MTGLCHAVLFFLWWDVALAVAVPSPTNVKLHCHNFDNLLTWNYDEFPPGLQFKVEIFPYSEDKGCTEPLWVEPPTLEANLSHLSDPENSYWVTVKAVMENQSEPLPDGGIEFSYSKLSPVSQHCSVDLPPLTVTPLPDHQIQIQFQHPWEFYKSKIQSCKKRKRKRELPPFKYDVTVDKKTDTVYCDERMCEKDLHLDPQQKRYCLDIEGQFLNTEVKSTNHCVQPPNEEKPYIYIVVVVAVVTVVVAMTILVMVYRKKTRPSTTLPNILKRFITVKPPTIPGVQDPIHSLEVEPSSPTPLISQTDVEDVEIKTPNYDSRSSPLPIYEVSQDNDEGPSAGERPAYMEGKKLEEDESDEEKAVFQSDYERRSLPNKRDVEE
uniref:Fibronectin type-III domain-containing protein n=1 Tax=Oryzias latipes TaxID=8090 RepID=A0A3P9I8W0_ORYLA